MLTSFNGRWITIPSTAAEQRTGLCVWMPTNTLSQISKRRSPLHLLTHIRTLWVSIFVARYFLWASGFAGEASIRIYSSAFGAMAWAGSNSAGWMNTLYCRQAQRLRCSRGTLLTTIKRGLLFGLTSTIAMPHARQWTY